MDKATLLHIQVKIIRINILLDKNAELARTIDLDRLMREVKFKADARDPALFAAGCYINPAGFYKEYLHLSGILLCAANAHLWVNKHARPRLDEKIIRLMGPMPVSCQSITDSGR